MKCVFVAVCAICVFCIVSYPTYVEATDVTAGAADNSTGQSPRLKAERDLKPQQKKGIVTIEFDANGGNGSDTAVVYKKLSAVVARILNAPSASGVQTTKPETAANGTSIESASNKSTNSVNDPQLRRRRATDGERYNEDGIGLVEVNPAIKDNKLRAALYAEDRDGNVLPAADLTGKLQANGVNISTEVGHDVSSVYVGMPEDTVEPLPKRPTVWELHWKMFLTVLILLAISIVMLIICCLCFCCCRRRKSQATANSKPESKKPLADEQMVELTPIVPLHSAPQQQQQPNGNEEQPLADDDNGWIVPIDQLSPDEMEQPTGVQISRL